MAVVVGRDPLDAGQAALVAAEKTRFNYALKLAYNDARDDRPVRRSWSTGAHPIG